jgi:hypothetical protein
MIIIILYRNWNTKKRFNVYCNIHISEFNKISNKPTQIQGLIKKLLAGCTSSSQRTQLMVNIIAL